MTKKYQSSRAYEKYGLSVPFNNLAGKGQVGRGLCLCYDKNVLGFDECVKNKS